MINGDYLKNFYSQTLNIHNLSLSNWIAANIFMTKTTFINKTQYDETNGSLQINLHIFLVDFIFEMNYFIFHT